MMGGRPLVTADESPGFQDDGALRMKPNTSVRSSDWLQRISDVHPSSPYRLPSWRWSLAQQIIENPHRRLRRFADAAVDRALAYQKEKALARYCAPAEHEALAATFPDLDAAFTLFASLPPPRRWEVEGRLLAAQPFEAIAARCSISHAAVAAYEALFFNVADRLHQRSYVLFQVIGQHLFGDLTASVPDPESLLKFFAYFGGSHVLDAVIGPLLGPAGGTSIPNDERTARLLRMAIAAYTVPVDQTTAAGLLRLATRLDELEREAASRVYVAVPLSLDVEDETSPASMTVGRTESVDSRCPGHRTAPLDEPPGADHGHEQAPDAIVPLPVPEPALAPRRAI